MLLPALPSVLIPGFDLRVGQVEGGRQIHAVLDAEILLPLEAPLQLVELMIREGRPRLPGLLGSHRRAVSAAGDLTVAFFLCPYERTRRRGRVLAPEESAETVHWGSANPNTISPQPGLETFLVLDVGWIQPICSVELIMAYLFFAGERLYFFAAVHNTSI